MVKMASRKGQNRTGRSAKTARLTTWLPSCSTMRGSTVSSQICGHWVAWCTRWPQACRHSKQVGSSSSLQRFRLNLTSPSMVLQRSSLTYWAVCSKKILSNAYLGSIWGSTRFGRKKSTSVSCQDSLALTNIFASTGMWTQTLLLSSRPSRVSSSQTWRTLSSLAVQMQFGYLKELRRTCWKRLRATTQ